MIKLGLFFFTILCCHYVIQGGRYVHHHHRRILRRLGGFFDGPEISTEIAITNIRTVKTEPVFKNDSIVRIAHSTFMEFVQRILPILEDKYNKMLRVLLAEMGAETYLVSLLQSLTPEELKQTKAVKFLEKKMTSIMTNLFGSQATSSRKVW